jgi:hypothetical protein
MKPTLEPDQRERGQVYLTHMGKKWRRVDLHESRCCYQEKKN